MSFKAWRRVPEPKACDFCLMLASRGAVYRTAATAGDGNDYHRHCRCDAVLETDFDAREDVWISPEDANRKIQFHNRKTNRTYEYDLRQFKVRNPPDVPMQAPVKVPELGSNVTWHGKPSGALRRSHEAKYRRVPADVREALESDGVRVHFTDGPITTVFKDAKGVRPRGWTAGSTWDSVSSGYRSSTKELVFGVGRGSSAGNVIAHECGHAVDEVFAARMGLATMFSRSPSFMGAYKKVTWTNPYFAQKGHAGRPEAFAEMFSIATQFPDDAARLSALRSISSTPDAALDLLRLTQKLVKAALYS